MQINKPDFLLRNDFVRKPVTRKRREKQCSHCKEIKPNQDFYNTITGQLSYRCKPCEDQIERKPKKIEGYNSYAVPSVRVTQSCPCKKCEYEKSCRILELDCPRYRNWQLGKSYKKFARVPDKHIDGSKPAPGVV